ncbi:PTS sugar transporter subunit IIA [Clostridium neuense]|uniref:PTS sugar transporter subunit IIA n=1 Tax=Clostridium neuense TaxID=1728934 RepID=A0ABW8TJT5_9CLOT
MRKIILASHSYLSKGMKYSVEKILGKQENLDFICAYVEDRDLGEEVRKKILLRDENDEIIIITDILGGSVNNELSKLLREKNIYLVTGMNLQLVIEILISNSQNIEELIENAIEESKKGIIFYNKQKVQIEDEDF